MIAGDLEIRLRADIARLQRDMDDARRVVGGALGNISRMADVAKGALAGIGAGLSLGALGHQVVEAQREFDKLSASLVTATGSTANAAQAFKALQSFASTTPYSVQEATEAFIKMRNLGLDPSERALRSYGNTAAAMGKSLEQMIEAVADASTGEFERLKEFGIKAKQNGDQVSLTFKGTTANIGNNAKEIQDYLRKIGEVDFGGGMELRAATLDGAISNLGDTWDSTMRTIATNGIGQATMSAVMGLSGALQDLSAILDVVGGAATKEGKAVSEAGALHKIATAVFETMAVLGVNVAYVFEQIGTELGGLAAQATLVLQGDFKGAAAIGEQMKKDAENARKAVDAKSDAILGASKAAQDAQAAEVEQMRKSGSDRLAQYAIELTAEEKRAAAKQSILDIENRLNGVNAQTAGDLKKLKAALDEGAISQAQYNRYAAQINKEAAQNSTAYKNAVKSIDQQTDALKRQAAARAYDTQQAKLQLDFLQRTGQVDEESFINQGAAADLKLLQDQRSALEGQLKLQRGKIDNQKEMKDLQAQIDQVGKDIAARELKRGNDLFELDQKRYREAVNNYGDLLEAAQAETKSQQDQVRDQQDYIATLGMTEQQIVAVNAARLRDQAAKLDELATLRDLQDASGQLGDEYRKQAEALRQRAAGTMLAAELEQQKEIWSSIENTAHDTFISIFDSGKSAFDRLRDALKNGLLDLLYQMTLKKWIISLQADVTGGVLSSAASAAGSAAGGGSSLSSAAGLVSTASNLYKMVTGGFAGISDMVAGGVQTAMSAMGYTPLASQGLATAGGQALTPLASGAGAAAGVLGGVAGGIYGGRLISGGYGSNGAVNTGTAIGAAVGSIVPVLGTALGALVGGLLGGTYNRLFGRKAPEVEAQGLRGIIGADGSVSGQAYKDIVEKGGLFRSTKRYDDDRPLNDQEQSQIGQAFLAITDASSAMAKSLGLGAEALGGYSKAFDIAFTDDAAKNQQAIEAFFGGVADEVAGKLVPNLASFSRTGETASATLQRLAGEFDATTAAVQNIGKTAAQAFGDAGIASAAARERLVQLAGGSNELVSLTSAFSQSFLTDAERLAPMAKALGEELGKLGLSSIPKTNEQLKQLVQGLDPANEAQAKLLVSLLQLAPAFNAVQAANDEAAKKAAEQQASLLEIQAQIYEITGDKAGAAAVLEKQHAAALEVLDPALRGATQQLWDLQAATKESEAAAARQASLLELEAQIAELTGDKAGAAAVLEKQHAAALAELDPALRGATEKLWALQEAAKATEQVKANAATLLSGVDGAFSALQQAVDREKTAVQASVDAHSAAATRLQSLSQALHGAFDGMQSPEQQLAARATGQAQIRAALAAARAGGPLPDADSLKDALAAVRQDASDQFSNRTDYLRDLYKTQNDIGALAGITDDQLSVEEKALQAAQDQLKSLDGVLARAQEQIDVLKGQSTTLLSIDQALGALSLAIKTAQANPVVASTSTITKAYQDALGRAPDAAGLAFWQDKAAAGVSTPDIVDAITGSAEAKNRAAIQKLYKELLGRQADDAGLGFFASSGSSLAEIAAAIKRSDEYKAKVPGFANGGDFGGGVRLVGEVGPEIETTGASRIHSTQSLIDALRNPSDNSAVLAAAVERLTATVERQERALEQIQRNTRRQADTIDVVTEGGKAMRTKEQTT